MRREFDFFDDGIIEQEMEDLPAKDAANLIAVMDHYETVGFDDPKPAKIQDYGEGIRSIRHVRPNYKGRALFYVGESSPGYQKLWILTVYKKESQEVPRNVLDRAKTRKATHESTQNTEREKKKK